MAGSVSSSAHAERVEEWGPINAMLTEFTSEARRRICRGAPESAWALVGRGRRTSERARAKRRSRGRPDLLVVASGNLAMLYLPRHPGRLTLEQLTELHPDLVAGLAEHPGIGFVVVETDTRGPVVIGRAGLRVLRDGTVEGQRSRCARYGEQIAADLLEHSGATTSATSSCAACSRTARTRSPPSRNSWDATAAPAARRPAPCCCIPPPGRRRRSQLTRGPGAPAGGALARDLRPPHRPRFLRRPAGEALLRWLTAGKTRVAVRVQVGCQS